MAIFYFIVQYLHCLIAGSMNVNILFNSPIYLHYLITGSMNVNILFYSRILHCLIAGSMNVNILFYRPISALSDSRVNECQYFIL